jgi:NADH:ubiquinone oxidoreductase subunit 5 (subunit L)/multisubunit Na+/H+ antiporter MnhA subunit
MKDLELMQLSGSSQFPLAGFLINGIFGRRFSKSLVNAIAIGSVVLSFAWVLKTLLGLGDLGAKPLHEHYFTWIQAAASTSAAISRSTGSPRSCC